MNDSGAQGGVRRSADTVSPPQARNLPQGPADHSARDTIFLYCAVGEAQQLRPIVRSAGEQAKLALGRLAADLSWRLLGRWRYHYWRYENRHYSNVGDIAIREACKKLIGGAAAGFKLRTVTWDHLTPEAIDMINREGAAFVVAGSGYFIFDDAWCIGYRVAHDAPLFDAIKVPKMMFGIGINNPQYREQPGASLAIDPEAVQAIRQMLGQFHQISVRDDLSKAILQPLTKTEIAVVPDPALFLAPPPGAAARPKARPDRVGINFALHSSIAEALLRANFRIYVEALKTYQAETGCHYIYFVHSDSEHKIAAMLTAEGVRLQKLSGLPDAMIAAYGTLSYHVCQMLHSAILAMSTGCPTLNIAYDVKSFGFFDMMGVPERCLTAEGITANAMVAAMRDLAKQRDEIGRHLAMRRHQLSGVIEGAARGVTAATQLPAG